MGSSTDREDPGDLAGAIVRLAEVAGELRAGQALQLWFNLFSRRYMAGRVSRAPGADEAPLLEGLETIKGQSRALD